MIAIAVAGAGMPPGRIERWYVQEQSISSDYHRYGNLGLRAQEVRGGAMIRLAATPPDEIQFRPVKSVSGQSILHHHEHASGREAGSLAAR